METFSEQSLSRRSFFRGQFLKTLQSEKVKTQGHSAIRPPWADLSVFDEKCTSCQQCITQCETNILVIGDNQLPEVDFSKGECTFCGKCVSACSEPIFRPTDEDAWQHKVEIVPSCLVFNRVECRVCEDSCEQRAIRFKREIGGIAKPVLDLTACNGCGACISSCPVTAIKILHNNNS